ncbi:signal peptidase I [Peptoniphilus equinus]|uniref:Signal peptidase I n=1 Tax=Peptoniphilus equinus TaxID=3016343 RepID=A0ABY7QUA7_9FIRM|nr:signal peptidase I [Peptoniphilus equinus]WBW50361.1 signal peptidase I [Peptoniphilus equinus]
MNSTNPNKDKRENTVLSYLGTFAVAIVLALLIKTFIFSSNMVVGESMEPTLHQDDRLIALILPLRFSDPDRGDIVIIDAPDEEGKDYIKRVVGVPGDTVSIHDGVVFLNDEPLDEDYTSSDYTEIYNASEWTLGENEFFVMGDNRLPGKSMDSRYFGPVEKAHVNGVVKLRFWPLSRAGIMN